MLGKHAREPFPKSRQQNQNRLTKADYIGLRKPYVPTPAKVIFVFESPPESGKYFYKVEKVDGEQLILRNDEAAIGN